MLINERQSCSAGFVGFGHRKRFLPFSAEIRWAAAGWSYTFAVQLWAHDNKCIYQNIWTQGSFFTTLISSDYAHQIQPDVAIPDAEWSLQPNTSVRDKLICLVLRQATAQCYRRAAQQTLGQRVICPWVKRENKNRISQRTDPSGHHIQSGWTNKHQGRQRSLFNGAVSNPFLQSMN